jgi:hypothetical protein
MAELVEQYLRVVEHTRSGLLGLKHRWTYVLVDTLGQEQRLHGTSEVLDALNSNLGRQDAYLCMHRASDLFRNGQSEWVGFISGAVVPDANGRPHYEDT